MPYKVQEAKDGANTLSTTEKAKSMNIIFGEFQQQPLYPVKC